MGSFKNTRLKWQILPLVWVVQRQNAFSFRGLRSLRPLTRGSAHGPRWGLCPTPPDPRYRFALRARHESYSLTPSVHPIVFDLATPLHIDEECSGSGKAYHHHHHHADIYNAHLLLQNKNIGAVQKYK